MANAKVILKRRKVVRNTRKITRTMELVSTAKYKQSFVRVDRAKPYRTSLQDMMSDLAANETQVEHPLLQRRDPQRHATVLLLTSNRGLCGGFNTHLVKTAMKYVRKLKADDVAVDLHVVGKKGIGTLRFQGVEMSGSYSHFGDNPTYDDVEVLASEFMGAYIAEKTDQVAVVYQHFLSAGVQEPGLDVLLPLASKEPENPEKKSEKSKSVDYIYSPNAEAILSDLLPAYFKTSMYHVFLESIVGEHRARMVAMKNATDSAEQMESDLTRLYNRVRQTKITSEISELMGGVEALK